MRRSMLSERSPIPDVGARPTAARRSALVVDDDPNVRTLLRLMLEVEGLQVETAENGFQAMARALHHLPSLVLLDLDIPILGGETIARELRATYGEAITIILISGNLDVAEVAQRVRADAYVPKPFSRAAVLAALRSTDRLAVQVAST